MIADRTEQSPEIAPVSAPEQTPVPEANPEPEAEEVPAEPEAKEMPAPQSESAG